MHLLHCVHAAQASLNAHATATGSCALHRANPERLRTLLHCGIGRTPTISVVTDRQQLSALAVSIADSHQSKSDYNHDADSYRTAAARSRDLLRPVPCTHRPLTLTEQFSPLLQSKPFFLACLIVKQPYLAPITVRFNTPHHVRRSGQCNLTTRVGAEYMKRLIWGRSGLCLDLDAWRCLPL